MLQLQVIRRLLAAILVSACGFAYAKIGSHLHAPGLARTVEATLHQEGLVGASWALVDGQATHVGSAGARDARRGELLLPTHRMQVGSVTKTVLAAGVLRLATQGRVSLDAPVAELLPGIVLENAWSKDHPVRLRHLLDHTSGLDDAKLWQVFGSSATPDAPLVESLGEDRSILCVRYRPGARLWARCRSRWPSGCGGGSRAVSATTSRRSQWQRSFNGWACSRGGGSCR